MRGFFEKRRKKRIKADQILAAMTLLGEGGTDQAVGVVMDVSESGLRIRTPHRMPNVGGVHLKISVGNEIHEVRTTIRWSSSSDGKHHEVGLAFARTEDHGRLDFLKAFLKTVRRTDRRASPSSHP